MRRSRNTRRNNRRNIKRSVRKNVKKNTMRKQRRVNRLSSRRRVSRKVSRRNMRKKLNKVSRKRKRKNKRNTLKGGGPKMPDLHPIERFKATINQENRQRRKMEKSFMLRVVKGWTDKRLERRLDIVLREKPRHYSSTPTWDHSFNYTYPTVYLSAAEEAKVQLAEENYKRALKEWGPISVFHSRDELTAGEIEQARNEWVRGIGRGASEIAGILTEYSWETFVSLVEEGEISDNSFVFSEYDYFPGGDEGMTWEDCRASLKRDEFADSNIIDEDTLYVELRKKENTDYSYYEYRWLQWWTTKKEGKRTGPSHRVWANPVPARELLAIYDSQPESDVSDFRAAEVVGFSSGNLNDNQLQTLKFYPKFTTDEVLGINKDSVWSQKKLRDYSDKICHEWVEHKYCTYGRICPYKHPPQYSREYKQARKNALAIKHEKQILEDKKNLQKERREHEDRFLAVSTAVTTAHTVAKAARKFDEIKADQESKTQENRVHPSGESYLVQSLVKQLISLLKIDEKKAIHLKGELEYMWDSDLTRLEEIPEKYFSLSEHLRTGSGKHLTMTFPHEWPKLLEYIQQHMQIEEIDDEGGDEWSHLLPGSLGHGK